MNIYVVAVLCVTVVMFVVLIAMYNGLIYKKNQVDNIRASIDALLKKRFDLIPNLVEAVKQYMNYESKLIKDVVELRSKALSSNDLKDKLKVENELEGKLKSLFVNFENYPDLKASNSLLQLQIELSDIESQISAARRTYNQVVTDFNNALEMFPTNIIASSLNYERQELFFIPENERENVNLKDLFEMRGQK